MPTRADLAKIHIAKKELHIDDATYRGVLWDRYRKESAADLTERQAADLVRHFRRLGWRPRPGRSPQRPGSVRQRRMILALWHRLEESGALEHPGEEALAHFVLHQTGAPSLGRLTVEEASRVIEALKAWLRRVGQGPG